MKNDNETLGPLLPQEDAVTGQIIKVLYLSLYVMASVMLIASFIIKS